MLLQNPYNMPQQEQIKTLFQQVDSAPESIVSPEKIAENIVALEPQGAAFDIARNELMALNLVESAGNGISSIGKIFCPKVEGVDPEGNSVQFPDMKLITPDMIEYWTRRLDESKHPFLIARYAGLIFDLTQPVTGKAIPHQFRNIYIEANLQLIERNQFKHPTLRVACLRRIIDLVLQYNDRVYYKQLKDLTLRIEQELHVQQPPGTWGFAYDLLFKNSSKMELTAEEEATIITRLEERIILYSTPDESGRTDPWAVKSAAGRLSEYYEKKKRPEEIKRVILAVGKAFEVNFETGSAMQVAGMLKELHQLYIDNRLNDEADEIMRRYREAAKKVPGDMGTMAHEVQLPQEEVDTFIDSLFTFEDGILANITTQFVPDKDLAAEQVKLMAKHHPLLFSTVVEILDSKGRLLAKVGPAATDLDGRTLLRINESIEFNTVFLLMALDRGIQNRVITPDVVIDLVSSSDVIESERLPIIKEALDNYFSGNLMVFLHLIIPQIEEAFRNLIELRGGKVMRLKDGVYRLKTFDDVLKDQLITDTLGENWQLYLRILFTDPRGMNLRNIISHGLEGAHIFNPIAAARVFHVLLLLGYLRFQTVPERQNLEPKQDASSEH